MEDRLREAGAEEAADLAVGLGSWLAYLPSWASAGEKTNGWRLQTLHDLGACARIRLVRGTHRWRYFAPLPPSSHASSLTTQRLLPYEALRYSVRHRVHTLPLAAGHTDAQDSPSCLNHANVLLLVLPWEPTPGLGLPRSGWPLLCA